ncbi:MAG: hypothetical protein GY847_29755 [Proteobacteria bacterium]|nr:hypothetical protein [Pseudomonadota bacterium]
MKYSKRTLFLCLFFLALMLGAVCCEEGQIVATDPGGDSDGDSDSDSDADGDGDDDDADKGTECPMENYTQSCCDGHGVQVCLADLTWDECDCGGPNPGEDGGVEPDDDDEVDPDNIVPEGNEDTEINFDWDEKDSDTYDPGACKAGRYVGNFDGIYTRKGGQFPFDDNGIVHDSSVEVSGVYPGVSININKSSNGEVFKISDGAFHGNALWIFTFEAEVEGELDCPTGKLRMKIINGFYHYPVMARRVFEGEAEADYDRNKHAFVNGRWRVSEPCCPGLNGGWGGWHAKRTGP